MLVVEPLDKNNDPSFVGVDELQRLQAAQVCLFEEWALRGAWECFHEEHYDWWTFPIRHTSAFGLKYSVFGEDIDTLRTREDFLCNLARASELLLLSWGWSLREGRYIPTPAANQRWHKWPIRLHKCATSLAIFGCPSEFESTRSFALALIEAGENMFHGSFDCGKLFVGD